MVMTHTHTKVQGQPSLGSYNLASSFSVENTFYVFFSRDAMLARYMMSSCVCLSHAGIVAKRLYPRSRKQRRTIAHGL